MTLSSNCFSNDLLSSKEHMFMLIFYDLICHIPTSGLSSSQLMILLALLRCSLEWIFISWSPVSCLTYSVCYCSIFTLTDVHMSTFSSIEWMLMGVRWRCVVTWTAFSKSWPNDLEFWLIIQHKTFRLRVERMASEIHRTINSNLKEWSCCLGCMLFFFLCYYEEKPPFCFILIQRKRRHELASRAASYWLQLSIK